MFHHERATGVVELLVENSMFMFLFTVSILQCHTRRVSHQRFWAHQEVKRQHFNWRGHTLLGSRGPFQPPLCSLTAAAATSLLYMFCSQRTSSFQKASFVFWMNWQGLMKENYRKRRVQARQLTPLLCQMFRPQADLLLITRGVTEVIVLWKCHPNRDVLP